MNLTNFEKTPMPRVFEFVKREAARYGVAVLESEIVGLVPQAALLAAAEYYLQLEGFTPSRCWRTGCGTKQRVDAASLVTRLLLRGPRRFARRDAERAHLPIEVAALDAEHFGGARHVAVLLRQRAQDVVALEPIARLVQRQQRRPRLPASRAAVATGRGPRNARSPAVIVVAAAP